MKTLLGIVLARVSTRIDSHTILYHHSTQSGIIASLGVVSVRPWSMSGSRAGVAIEGPLRHGCGPKLILLTVPHVNMHSILTSCSVGSISFDTQPPLEVVSVRPWSMSGCRVGVIIGGPLRHGCGPKLILLRVPHVNMHCILTSCSLGSISFGPQHSLGVVSVRPWSMSGCTMWTVTTRESSPTQGFFREDKKTLREPQGHVY